MEGMTFVVEKTKDVFTFAIKQDVFSSPLINPPSKG
jgi:hypothetical protein